MVAGKIAGGDNGSGYIRIMIDNERISAHRLAWFYVYGTWPSKCIDHINHKKDDNRICNLRNVTQLENLTHRVAGNLIKINVKKILTRLSVIERTPAWLARKIKISQQLLNYWMKVGKIRDKAAEPIGNALGIEPKDLLK